MSDLSRLGQRRTWADPPQQPGESDEEYGHRLDAFRQQQRDAKRIAAEREAEPPQRKLERVRGDGR